MTTKPQTFLPMPDPPEGKPEDMTNFNQTNLTGNTHHLIHHLGNRETTLVAGEHYLSRVPTRDLTGVRYPDLLIAFGVNPATYYRNNAYIISEQGKPPDFVLEIASRSTGREDIRDKRVDYAALGIPEYWRFDETGEFHGTRLAGDRLVEGRYEPVPIETVGESVLQGYCAVLNLLIRWENGQLRWHDPATGEHIPTFEQERGGRIAAEAQRDTAEAQRDTAEAQRDTAEARVRELEARLEESDRGG